LGSPFVALCFATRVRPGAARDSGLLGGGEFGLCDAVTGSHRRRCPDALVQRCAGVELEEEFGERSRPEAVDLPREMEEALALDAGSGEKRELRSIGASFV
jgi:hypothetical protein